MIKNILIAIKSFWIRKKTFLIVLFTSVIAILATLESTNIKCDFTDNIQMCGYVLGKVPVWSLLFLIILLALWSSTTACVANIFHDMKAFVKKRPIVSALIAVAFFGLFPFPVRCSTAFIGMLPPPGSTYGYAPTKILDRCYYPLRKEFWTQSQLEFHVSYTPILWILITDPDGSLRIY